MFPQINEFSVQPFDCWYADTHNPFYLSLKSLNDCQLNQQSHEDVNATHDEKKHSVRWSQEKVGAFIGILCMKIKSLAF